MKEFFSYDPIMVQLLVDSGSDNLEVSRAANYKLAKAIQLPLREAILSGDNLTGMNIFEAMPLSADAAPEFPLDIINPGSEVDYIAYNWNGDGKIPQRLVESEYVTINTFPIANAIDWLQKHARVKRFDIVGRALNVFRWGFTKKMNDSGWATILTAAVDRNILVYDADATAGTFTKRLISLGKVTMRRNGGGNATSLRRSGMTDMAVSPESLEDVRNWNVDQLDEISRHEIFLASDGSGKITRIFGVNLHDMDEFGAGQEYQNYYTTNLGASLQASDVELAVGLDLANRDSFVMPIRQEVTVYPDDSLMRAGKNGVFGTADVGFGVLDNRRVLALSF